MNKVHCKLPAHILVSESLLKIQRHENLKIQVLMSGEVMPAEKVPELIAGITTADVQVTNPCFQTALSKFCFTSDLTLFFQAAAKKLSSAKLSMGACGNLSTVPFLDSL